MKPISEKAAEILFTRFLLQAFSPMGSIQLFAPSSWEELKKGYDAKFSGVTSCREIYLQFKAPNYSESKERFTIQLTRHQHHILLQRYPSRSAYYVAPMFPSLRDLNRAQETVGNSADFLKYFVCIEVSTLPPEADFMQFVVPRSHRESPEVKFKTPSDGNTKTARHRLTGDAWMRGSILLAKFKTDEIGHSPQIGGGEMWGTVKPNDAIATAEENGQSIDLGVLIRKLAANKSLQPTPGSAGRG